MSEEIPETPSEPAKPEASKPATGNGMNRTAIAGMAIGSTALVAALLYANRGRGKDKGKA